MPEIAVATPQKTASRVAVVAAGIVSPLGLGLDETVGSLRVGRDCVSSVTRFPIGQCRCSTAGQIPDQILDQAGNQHPDSKRRHRVAQMMTLALGEALRQAPNFQPEISIVATTSGGMTFGEEYYRRLKRAEVVSASTRSEPALIANYTPQKAVMDAQEAFNINAPCQIVANACASGTNAIGHAFECVRSGQYQQVLTGGYDAISELVFVGFDSLQASTPEKCRPFDRERTGMVLGEGAAVLLLENLDLAVARGAKVLAEIIGYGISTDNYHLTQPNPSGIGPRQAMEGALRDAGIEAGSIGYINAHGTATPFNDAAEGKAITELFDRVPVSSTKSMMGHSLGAAGAIEAVISILALQNRFLPPNINFRDGDAELDLNIISTSTPAPHLRTALSNSFGFGGTNASIILRTPEA
jgi:3-oxoacyl-[acyl-carrier-protein] synthase II